MTGESTNGQQRSSTNRPQQRPPHTQTLQAGQSPGGHTLDYKYSGLGDITPRVLFLQLLLDPWSNLEYFYGQKDLRDALIDRVVDPIQIRTTQDPTYFTKPYGSGVSFFAGLVAGPGMFVWSLWLGYDLLLIPALTELTVGVVSLGRALFYKMKGDNVTANKYWRDGIARLILSPFLALLSAASVLVELVRFITRMIATLVQAANKLFEAGRNYVSTRPSGSDVVVPAPQPRDGDSSNVPPNQLGFFDRMQTNMREVGSRIGATFFPSNP